MDKLRKIYNFNLAALDYASKNIHADLSSYQKGDIEVFSQKITEAFGDFKVAYHNLYINADDSAETSIQLSETQGEFRGKSDLTDALLRKLANHKESLNVLPPLPPSTSHRLPPLKGLKFSGLPDSIAFGSFWANFSTLVDQTSLSPTTKFLHLLENLEGPALNLVVSLKVSDENYQKATQLLEDRFNRIDSSVNDLIQKILTLKPSERIDRDRSFSNIEAYINEIRSAVADLELYDYSFNEKTIKKILGSLVFANLPFTIRQLLTLKTGELFPTYDQIIKYYPDTLEMLKSKALDTNKSKKVVCQVSASRPLSKPVRPPVEKTLPVKSAPQKIADNKIIQKSNSNPAPTCKFCSENNHVSTWCPMYPSVSARKTQLDKLKKCNVCMSGKHLGPQCKHTTEPFDFACFICKTQQHISPLCPDLKLKQ